MGRLRKIDALISLRNFTTIDRLEGGVNTAIRGVDCDRKLNYF
jgi:hypothetical protein